MLVKVKKEFKEYKDVEEELSFPFYGISKSYDDFGSETYFTLLKVEHRPESYGYERFVITEITATLHDGGSAQTDSWDEVRIRLYDTNACVVNGSLPFVCPSLYSDMRIIDDEVTKEEFNKVASSILAQYGSLQLI